VVRQCQLLEVGRSSYYYEPQAENAYNQQLMRLLDEQYTRTPFYGSPRMTAWLRQQGHPVNHKRIERLMEQMGLQAIYPKPNLSKPAPGHNVYPYLLRNVKIEQVDQVWSCDITYIRMASGFIYLMAVIDWFSRYVLSWSVSISLEVDFCMEALDAALRRGRLPATLSPGVCKQPASPSAWMAVGEHWTTSLLSGYGERSSMKRSTSSPMTAFPKPLRA
jgi:putative transposase